jgi:hypothetical protein
MAQPASVIAVPCWSRNVAQYSTQARSPWTTGAPKRTSSIRCSSAKAWVT